jgi:nitrite reductase/ring-hydroxylating ferredoxin subunit
MRNRFEVSSSSAEASGCGGCRSRRQFLGESATIVAAFAAAMGVSARQARAWTLTETAPAASQGDTLTYPIPAADGVSIDYGNQVILVRWQGDVFAFNLACPHENTALKWRADDHRFQCPRHDSKYTPEGVFMEGRATRNMDRFAIRRDGGSVVVDLNKLWRSDDNTAEWNAAFVKV